MAEILKGAPVTAALNEKMTAEAAAQARIFPAIKKRLMHITLLSFLHGDRMAAIYL